MKLLIASHEAKYFQILNFTLPLQPLQVLKRLLQWISLEIIVFLTQRDVWAFPESEWPAHVLAFPLINYYVRCCFLFVDIDVSDDSLHYSSTEAPDTAESMDKVEYTLEPCDKVATLYVMQQKFESPTNHDSQE